MKSPALPYGGLLLFALLALCLVSVPLQGTQAHDGTYYVDISTTPASGFLQATNMAPGDRESAVLLVANDGTLAYNTTVSARQEAGDLDYYAKLQVRIADSRGLLYEGGFADLQNFPLGTVAVGEGRSLTFAVELPKEAGNELQGRTARVAFDFTAVGHDEQVPVGEECFEPPFSNRNFTLHQKSTVPIKFHLHDPDGRLDTELRQDVRLEVTGPSVSGGSVTYPFTVANGTLKFGEVRDEPHYHARFSTWDFPVVTDGWYTATVYAGERIMCQKTFQVLERGNRSNAP